MKKTIRCAHEASRHTQYVLDEANNISIITDATLI
jgi:hypothetical protein